MAYRGFLFKGFRGLSDLRMADGLMNLVDEVNLKRFSLLAREFWVWRQMAHVGVADL